MLKIIALLLSLVLLIVGILVSNAEWETKNFSCELIQRSYKGSTLESHAVPTLTTNGVGVGVVTTGDSEQYASVFECEKLGLVVSNKKEIFTKARKHNELLIKTRDADYRVIEIK